MTPYDNAVSLFEQGHVADHVITQLRASGLDDASARVATNAAWSRVRGSRYSPVVTLARVVPRDEPAPQWHPELPKLTLSPSLIGVGLFLLLEAVPSALFLFFAIQHVADWDVVWRHAGPMIAVAALSVIAFLSYLFSGRSARHVAYASLLSWMALSAACLLNHGVWTPSVVVRLHASAPMVALVIVANAAVLVVLAWRSARLAPKCAA